MSTLQQNSITVEGRISRGWGIYDQSNNEYFLLVLNSALENRSIEIKHSVIPIEIDYFISESLMFRFEFGGLPELECLITIDKEKRLLKSNFNIIDENVKSHRINYSDSEIYY